MRSPALTFAVWTAFIFSLSPTARVIQAFLCSYSGASFIAAVLLALAAAGFIGCLMLLRKRQCSIRAFLALAVVASIFSLAGITLEKNPEEIFHFFEYGLLSFLSLKMLTQESPSWTTRLAAALIAAAVGVSDELFQWVLPSRVFDFRDIGLNLFSALLVQAGLIFGDSDTTVRGSLSRENLRTLCSSALLFILLLLICALLTPPNVRGIVSAFPGLALLEDEPVIDFGFEHRIDSWIVFRSHFSLDELQRIDLQRGPGVEEILAHRSGGREDFLRKYSEMRDPFLHEVEVHLFRRNIYIRQFDQMPSDSALAKTAFAEEKILEEYFPHSVAHGLLKGERRDRLSPGASQNGEYFSPVAENVIVRFSAATLQLFSGGFCLLLAICCIIFREKRE